MKKALKVIVNVLAWVLLVLAFLITLIVFTSDRNNGVANLLGFMPMSVQTDSMKPTFKEGDLVLIKEIDDLFSLKEDDVITFYTIIDGKRVKNTHRIVKVNDNGNSRSFTTRGDNNPIDDTLPVNASDIIGKWTGVKLGGAGKALDFLRTKKGFFICILLPMILFFLFELYKFIVALIEVKRPEPEEIDEEEIKRKAIEEYLAKEKAAKEAAEAAVQATDTAEKAAEEIKEAANEAVNAEPENADNK